MIYESTIEETKFVFWLPWRAYMFHVGSPEGAAVQDSTRLWRTRRWLRALSAKIALPNSRKAMRTR